MFNINDFDDYFEKLHNDKTFQSFFSDSFDDIKTNGTGWYLSTCSYEQLKILEKGAKIFINTLVKKIQLEGIQHRSQDNVSELVKSSMKDKEFNIFLNIAVSCIFREINEPDPPPPNLFKLINSFYLILYFEICLRDGLITPIKNEKYQHMFVTNIEETFIDFKMSEKAKEIEKKNIIKSICMN